jgi:hypothetical protein
MAGNEVWTTILIVSWPHLNWQMISSAPLRLCGRNTKVVIQDARHNESLLEQVFRNHTPHSVSRYPQPTTHTARHISHLGLLYLATIPEL